MSLVSAKDLPIEGPEHFYRIQNSDGTTSLRSKEDEDRFIVADVRCFKLHLRGQGGAEPRFEIYSACSNFHVPLQLPSHHGRPTFQFESNWYNGLQFYIAFKHQDGSVSVLLSQSQVYAFSPETATISGKVSDGSISTIQPMLKANNLYKDTHGNYHLRISGTNQQLCFDRFSEYSTQTGLLTRQKAFAAAPSLNTSGCINFVK